MDKIVKKILELKEKKKALILAHNYQIPRIQDIADFVGDSLELSKTSKKASAPLIVFCGVRFMAETAKILSSDKKVLLPAQTAGCPLAETISASDVINLRKAYPDAWVVSYVNTSAEVKAVSDVCCTSGNAVDVVKNVPTKDVIFVPDKNLGWWVQKNVPEKNVILWNGGCYVHEQFTLDDLHKAREKFPQAEIMVHPECKKEILEESDFIASTAGMLKRAKQTAAKTIIIGTEEGLLHKLRKENPDKEFFSLGISRTCLNMKKTTLDELLVSLEKEIYEIRLDADIIVKAGVALERMVQYI
jgi:quinolinate synthase